MSMTSKYDPSNREHKVTCTRSKCAELERPAHPAGVHLDQRSEFYDGPESALDVASVYVRDSARKIITEAPALTPEVIDLVNYCDFMRTRVAHARVDRDRGIREAQARSESCEHHGEEIKALGDQVHAISQGERRHNAGRQAVLGLLFDLDKVTEAYRDGQLPGLTVEKLIKSLEDASKKTHAAHDRAWTS
jgi:hypothetical protein